MGVIRKFATATVFTLLIAVLFTSCKLNYKEADITETLADEIPNSILENFSQTVVENGNVSYFLSADYAETYNSKRVTYFDNIGFREYTAEGKTGTEGAAEKAVHYSDTDNIVFDGRIILNSESQNFVVKSDYLEWNNEKKILKSMDKTHVVIEQGEETKVEGYGFIADAQGKSFTFLENAAGRFVEDEETD